MAQEMTSFVLRFVREVSEEQEARWRGLIQHVQSGSERNFATFADAVQFMQGRVLEHTARKLGEEDLVQGRVSDDTVRSSEEEEVMGTKSPLSEMAKMWGDLGPQMVGMWTETAERVMDQSSDFRAQVDQAVTAALETWGAPGPANQESVVNGFVQMNAQIQTLIARVEALEEQLIAIQKKQERGEDETSESE